ncbi:MAG: hypothetical protein ACNI27_03070 [Desulfovibrio sp.]
MITVHIEPEKKTEVLYGIKSVHALLNRLGLHRTMALIIRDGKLLTQDRKLHEADEITVRKVISVG